MIDRKRIEEEAAHFFEWPGTEKTVVTMPSMILFAEWIAEMARTEIRGRS